MSPPAGRSARGFQGGLSTPDRRPREPVTWGRIFFITLAIVFAGEFLVMGVVIPFIWPEPASLWHEVTLDAVLLSLFTALALLPIFSRFEQRSASLEAQLLREKKLAGEVMLTLSAHKDALDRLAIVTETDPDGVLTYVNDKFCEISQYSNEELTGEPHRIVNSGVHPKSFWKAFWQTISSNEIWRGEICNRARNGSLYWVDAIVVPFQDSSGNITKYVSIQIESTRRKIAEESTALRIRLLHALSSIAEMPGTDPAETLRLAIEKGREQLLFEKATLGRVEGDHLVLEIRTPRTVGEHSSLPLPETYGGLTIQAQDVLAIQKMSASPHASQPCFQRFGYESFIGSTVIVEGRAYGTLEFLSTMERVKPFDEAEIEFVRLLARLVGSVINRRNAHQALAAKNLALDEAKKNAEQLAMAASVAARAKADFLANMSHEIRTPLNAIIGMTDLLLDSGLPHRVHEHLDTVRTSSDSLLAIINDILDFSKIESGQLELESRPVQVRECVEAVLDLNASAAARKGLELLYWIEADVPPAILSDPTRLQQILLNLATNAVKFTESGEVVIRVRRHKEAGGKDFLHFSVRDTGIGIPEEVRDRLFQVFSQVDSSTTRRFGGTGLGLAISRRLTEIMGGKIWVASAVGKGADFQFIIPLLPATEIPPEVSPKPAHDLTGVHVLIVDDNATNRWILSEQTRSWGMVPREATGGVEAIAIEESGQKIDLVLLDVQMPDMDGYTLAGELRARRPDLNIIILTSLADHDRSRLKNLRISRFLTKPVKAVTLHETICGAVAGQKQILRPHADLEDLEIAGECPLRILVAEDHPTNQRIIKLMLERLGYRPEIVANGAEVLASVRRQTFDAVILDVQMPVMDGLTAAREICRMYPAGKRPWILAMTANALEGDREKCLAAGMDDYISKPVKTTDLSAAMRRAYSRLVPPR
ncbi:MAG: response regulator [Verrucomicrobia bacterium]|nr:response regulator [Verrucomicrobiota bacterium]